MGSESSIFKKCVIQHDVQYNGKYWTLHLGKYERTKLSIFMFNETNTSFDISYWKTLRHPYIVKYYDCGVFRKKRCVVTECVEPLKSLLPKMNVQQLIAGLSNVTEALRFMHDTCKLSHNNVSIDTIFVSKSDSECWKLGSMFCTSSIPDESDEFLLKLSQYHSHYGTTNILPPEDLLRDKIVPMKANSELHRRDCYALGSIISQLLSNIKLSDLLKSMMCENPLKRPQMTAVLSDNLYNECDFLQIKLFLMNFASHSQLKDNIIDDIINRLQNIPQSLIAPQIVSIIFSSRVLMSHLEIQTKLLPLLLVPLNDDKEVIVPLSNGKSLTIKPFINTNLFKSQIIPLICKMYSIRDYNVRMTLLQYLPYHSNLISVNCFRELVLPQILLGIKDTNDDLVALTLQSLSHLVKVFGATIVMGPRVKLFHSGIPKYNLFNEDNSSSSLSSSSSSSTFVPITFNDTNKLAMLERSSPDGGESDINSIPVINETQEVLEDLKEVTESLIQLDYNDKESQKDHKLILKNDNKTNQTKNEDESSAVAKSSAIKEIDIKALDFKLENTEIDFFSDMEPVLKFDYPKLEVKEIKELTNASSLFAVKEENVNETGWDDNEWNNELE